MTMLLSLMLAASPMVAMPDDLAAVPVHQLLRRVVEHILAAAADIDFGAEAQIVLGHFLAEAGAAAGHENALALQQVVAKHRMHHVLRGCVLPGRLASRSRAVSLFGVT